MAKKSLFFLMMTLWLGPVVGFSQDTIQKKKSQDVWQQVKEHVSVGGWIDAQYAYDQRGDDHSSVMQIRRARLDIKGSLSKWVDFRLQSDFAPNPRLIDAFVKVNFCQYVQLQVGQFKIPFSIENKYSPLDLELTENAQVISALSGYKDVTGISSYANGREIGLMLTGTLASAEVRGEKIPILKYGVGLFGGNGINVKTDNMAKDVSARIEFSPFVKNMIFSASGYWGKYNIMYDGASTDVDGRRYRYAAGAEYNDKKWVVRGEYVAGLTDLPSLSPSPDHDGWFVKPAFTQGFYVVAGYWFDFGWGKDIPLRQKLRPVVRFDYYRYDQRDALNTPSLYYSAGLDWWPERHVRVQLNYTLKQRCQMDQLGHTLTAMVSVKF